MSFKKRILEFIQYASVGQTKFEEIVGIGRASISKIKDGMSSTNIAKIKKAYPEINLDWLITGEGDMLLSEAHSGIAVENNIDYKESYLIALKKIEEKNEIIKTLHDTIKSENALHKDLEDMGLSSIPEKERKKYEGEIKKLYEEIGVLKYELKQNSLEKVKGGDNTNVKSKAKLAGEETPANKE